MSLTTYFINKTTIIENKYKKIMNNLLNEYNNKNIKTKTEYLYYANIATKNFINTLSTPLFKYCPAKSTPLSEHFNIMINSAIDDLDILFNESISLGNHVNAINNEIVSYIDMFNYLSNKMTKEITHLEENINSIKDEQHYIFSDSFDDNTKSTIQLVTDSCKMDMVNGFISIGTTIEREYSSSLLIKMSEESNGFPGNTHEIEVLNDKVKFIGENEPYINMYNMSDGKNNSWFEYEAYKVPDENYLDCNGFGFSYKENISWLLEEDELNLNLTFYLEESKLCNWLSISPFLHVNKNSKFPIIDYVIISDGIFDTQKIIIGKEFDDVSIIAFEPQDIKYITVRFSQKFSYETNIGHFFSLKIDKNVNIFDTIVKNDYKRIDGKKPSVELLGMKYDPSTKKCSNPDYTHKKNFTINPNITKNELFAVMPSDTADIYNDIEILKAYRYCISIKNISIANYVFNESSIHCSIPYKTDNNIVFLELEVKDYIPESFKTANEEVDYHPNLYLKYEVSFDDGNVWYEINPKHRVQYGPCAISINSDVLPSMRSPRNIRYIDRLLDTKSIMLRIMMNRPEGYIYDSPIVYSYKLNVRTEEDLIEHF